MSLLSRPVAKIKSHYDAVIVGSGYGASIAACRIARTGRSVCLLERGREIPVGAFPNNPVAAAGEFQVRLPDGTSLGRSTGLYDVRVNDDITIAVGCGLGGTSLINANVALEPEDWVFQDHRWPKRLRDDLAGLRDGFSRALEMLEPVPYPGIQPLAKLEAQRKAAAATGGTFSCPPITVTFAERSNAAGVRQPACTLCGDCCSGCNIGAKNTLMMNYLPDAARSGAEIFTQVLVKSLAKDGDRWRVRYVAVADLPSRSFENEDRYVLADHVFVGAGSLGSTEILLRSREDGLPLSDLLGERFTSNGDVLAFAYNCEDRINGMGAGFLPPGVVDPVGPCITGLIDKRQQPRLEAGFVLEEGVIPGALAGLVQWPLTKAAGFPGGDSAEEIARIAEALAFGPYRGALNHTQTYLAMAHDDGQGQIVLESDRLIVRWPGVASQKIFADINDTIRTAAAALGGTFVANPLWNPDLPVSSLATVHPMGGCVMGDSSATGVVNDMLEAFSGQGPSAVHAGLHVVDGSVIPMPLGVNPFLTISAIAERAVANFIIAQGWGT